MQMQRYKPEQIVTILRQIEVQLTHEARSSNSVTPSSCATFRSKV